MNKVMKQETTREAEALQFDIVEMLKVLKGEATTYSERELKMLSGAILMAAQTMQELMEK